MLYVHEDVLGNTRYYTKWVGQQFSELRYDVWGAPTLSGKLLNNDNGNFARATFTGHVYDTTLDIYHAEARFYDAKYRQFMSTDPIKDGLNWYAYVGANPVTFTDPTGLESWENYQYYKDGDNSTTVRPTTNDPGERPNDPVAGALWDALNDPRYQNHGISELTKMLENADTIIVIEMSPEVAQKLKDAIEHAGTQEEIRRAARAELGDDFFENIGIEYSDAAFEDIANNNDLKAFWGEFTLLKWDMGLNVLEVAGGIADMKVNLTESDNFYLIAGALSADAGLGLSLNNFGVSAEGSVVYIGIGLSNEKRNRELRINLGSLGAKLKSDIEGGFEFGINYGLGFDYKSYK